MTLPADTLVCDTARLAVWQSDGAYNYNRELLTPEVDVWAWVTTQAGRLLSTLFGTRFAQQYTEVVLVAIIIVLLLLLLWFLYKKRPELFMRSHKNKLAYSLEADTIYGIDFTAEIDKAVARGEYRQAIRLIYLQTLKQLSDDEQIDWQPYKTPTEYTYEVKAATLRAPFRNLTNLFLRVRYGNFEATETLFRAMQTLQQEVQSEGGNR